VEARLRDKALYKLTLYLLKTIPMMLAAIQLLNTLLSGFGIDLPLLSYIGGVSLLPLVFLYLASYVFRFCACHRMFLHYVAVNTLLNIYDLYVGIPLDDRQAITLYLVLACIFLFITLFLYVKTDNKAVAAGKQ